MRLDLYPLEKETDHGLLTRVAEECAEVIVAVCKCKRFGIGNHHPDREFDNLADLLSELKDVEMCIAEMRRRLK